MIRRNQVFCSFYSDKKKRNSFLAFVVGFHHSRDVTLLTFFSPRLRNVFSSQQFFPTCPLPIFPPDSRKKIFFSLTLVNKISFSLRVKQSSFIVVVDICHRISEAVVLHFFLSRLFTCYTYIPKLTNVFEKKTEKNLPVRLLFELRFKN